MRKSDYEETQPSEIKAVNIDEAFKKMKKEIDTDDYQNRGGNYPKSGVPVSVRVYKVTEGNNIGIECSFKNTSEDEAIGWLKKNTYFLSSIESLVQGVGLSLKEIKYSAVQDGDYDDDWVTGYVEFFY